MTKNEKNYVMGESPQLESSKNLKIIPLSKFIKRIEEVVNEEATFHHTTSRDYPLEQLLFILEKLHSDEYVITMGDYSFTQLEYADHVIKKRVHARFLNSQGVKERLSLLKTYMENNPPKSVWQRVLLKDISPQLAAYTAYESISGPLSHLVIPNFFDDIASYVEDFSRIRNVLDEPVKHEEQSSILAINQQLWNQYRAIYKRYADKSTILNGREPQRENF